MSIADDTRYSRGSCHIAEILWMINWLASGNENVSSNFPWRRVHNSWLLRVDFYGSVENLHRTENDDAIVDELGKNLRLLRNLRAKLSMIINKGKDN